MMDGRITHLWFVALCVTVCRAAPVSDSLLVLVESPDSVQRGHTTTLPCWISPPQSAEDLEVRWYRGGQFDTPIMLYVAKKFKDVSQEASYVGRVSFGLKDAASGGLKTGDVSLKLADVTVEDAGDYTCYVSSNQGYDSGTLRLLVTETGSPPLLTAEWKEDNRVNVSCESEGWFPQPVLRWSDQKQDVSPESLVYANASSGLFSVHSWLLLPSSSQVSCSVGPLNKEAIEARIRLDNPPQPAKRESGSSVGGWVAFTLLLIATLIVCGAVYFKKRAKKPKSGSARTDENETLLPKETVQPTALSTYSKYYVNIKLEDTANQFLTIKNALLRDAAVNFPDGLKVTCLTAIKGTPGFSGGQHYWEVSLGKIGPLGLKQSWWIGVTSAAKIPHDLVSPNTSDGFWFLSSSPDTAGTLQLSTEPKVSLPVHSRLQTVGVYLNYDRGELSFYNVEDKSLIGSLTATFAGEVFPFFNPGKGDKVPMEILQRTDQSQCDDEGTSVDSAAQVIISSNSSK